MLYVKLSPQTGLIFASFGSCLHAIYPNPGVWIPNRSMDYSTSKADDHLLGLDNVQKPRLLYVLDHFKHEINQ